jgi:hypothetical protein
MSEHKAIVPILKLDRRVGLLPDTSVYLCTSLAEVAADVWPSPSCTARHLPSQQEHTVDVLEMLDVIDEAEEGVL